MDVPTLAYPVNKSYSCFDYKPFRSGNSLCNSVCSKNVYTVRVQMVPQCTRLRSSRSLLSRRPPRIFLLMLCHGRLGSQFYRQHKHRKEKKGAFRFISPLPVHALIHDREKLCHIFTYREKQNIIVRHRSTCDLRSNFTCVIIHKDLEI